MELDMFWMTVALVVFSKPKTGNLLVASSCAMVRSIFDEKPGAKINSSRCLSLIPKPTNLYRGTVKWWSSMRTVLTIWPKVGVESVAH
jgi:hypothetical protein